MIQAFLLENIMEYIFTSGPSKSIYKFSIGKFNKFKLELYLLLFGFFLSFLMDAILYWVLKSVSSQIDQVELVAMGIFGCLFLIMLHLILLKQLFESYKLFKKLKSDNDFNVFLDEANLYIPFILLEGFWREKCQNKDGNFLKVSYLNIEEYSVEPSKGIKRVSPPYYKLKLVGEKEHIFILRSYFKKRENEFIENIKKKIPNIVFNDELR